MLVQNNVSDLIGPSSDYIFKIVQNLLSTLEALYNKACNKA